MPEDTQIVSASKLRVKPRPADMTFEQFKDYCKMHASRIFSHRLAVPVDVRDVKPAELIAMAEEAKAQPDNKTSLYEEDEAKFNNFVKGLWSIGVLPLVDG